jgi:hypothetical protein
VNTYCISKGPTFEEPYVTFGLYASDNNVSTALHSVCIIMCVLVSQCQRVHDDSHYGQYCGAMQVFIFRS